MSLENKKPVVRKAVNRFGKLLEIKRSGVNDFGEPVGETIVTTVTAFYYKGRNHLSIKLDIAGEIKSSSSEKLMIVVDDNSKLIKEGDYFSLNGVNYEIADISNSFDLYYDITLKKAI